jgi:hypothetical protein
MDKEIQNAKCKMQNEKFKVKNEDSMFAILTHRALCFNHCGEINEIILKK